MQTEQTNKCSHQKGHIEAGATLIVIGLIFLLHQLQVIQFELHWYIIAAIGFSVMGLVEIAQFHKPHKIFEGISKLALAAWFYVSFSGMWGFSPATSWPLVLIISGVAMVARYFFTRSKSIDTTEK